jgi:signal transduction histidine kinase
VQIEVSDTGIGIPVEAQPAIFEPFQQVNPGYTRRHGGSGLGLAIAKRLVELMDGGIAVASEPGRGTTFRVQLPVSRAAAAGTGPAGDRPEDAGSKPPVRPG